MERVEVRGLELEVDVERTVELYERRLGGCPCDLCVNARIARFRHTPPAQVAALRALGVDPWRPCLSDFGGRRPHDSPRHTRRLACWFLYGKIVGEAPTPKVRFDRWNWMWADASRAAIRAWDGELDDLDAADPELVYVFASNALPWFFGEVAEFRTTASPCPACGRKRRKTGYLKRRSLIPQWEERPDLAEVLRKRKHRVYVEFCDACGHLESRIVSRTPPFRGRNAVEINAVK